MSIVSIKSRLNRAIDRLPVANEKPTVAGLDAMLVSRGIDPEETKRFVCDPNATELETVIAISSLIPLHGGMPGYQWSEAQALCFLKWRDEKRQKRYYKTSDGKMIRK